MDPLPSVVCFSIPVSGGGAISHLTRPKKAKIANKNIPKNGLGDNCQILAVRSDICKIGQLSDQTTVSADNCQIRQLSDRTTVRSDNCQIGQLSVGQLSVGHGQLSEKTVSALKKL